MNTMHKRICVSLMAGLGLAPPLVAQDFSKVELQTTALADNLYVIAGGGGNVAVSVGEDGDAVFSIDGEDITIRTTESGAVEIECDIGGTFTLTGDQLDAIGGCSGAMNADDNGVECEAKPGTYTADCTFDFDCDDGLRCCGPMGGEKKCLLDAQCDVNCSQDADCSAGNICCDAGLIRMCLDLNTCQNLQEDEASP